VPDHPFREVVFSDIQSEPSLAQLEAIPSSPSTRHTRGEAEPQLTTTSLHIVIESNKVSSQPPLLQTEQFQLLQPLLIRPALQTPDIVSLRLLTLHNSLYLTHCLSLCETALLKEVKHNKNRKRLLILISH